MKFRPCIDIHNGKVKQIVGGSLRDKGDEAVTNFASELDASYYAEMYKRDGLKGGHIILLNPPSSPYYEATRQQAQSALRAYPGGMQIGGGIRADNAAEYLDAGASHVIVTSYVFQDGVFHRENLEKLKRAVGKEHLVLDLSCRRKPSGKGAAESGEAPENGRTAESSDAPAYYIVTNRWQTFTEVKLTREVLDELAESCDEFLVHGVDVEGKASGVERELVRMLGGWNRIPVTYAGGIGTWENLEDFRRESGGNLDFTIGSALDLFGGKIPYERIVKDL